MAKLLPIALISFVNLMVASPRSAEAVCSLAIQVVTNTGAETPARVEVREQDGTIHVRQNKPGGVEFCSLGLLPVDVYVGSGPCNRVILKNVPLRYERTIKRVVSYDTADCEYDAWPSSGEGCYVLIRAVDELGRPVPTVGFSVVSPPGRTLRGDSLGRALALISVGHSAVIQVFAPGLESKRLNLDCAKNGEAERKVVMKKGNR